MRKQIDIGHRRLQLKVWDNYQKTFTSAFTVDKMKKRGKRDWNSLMKPQAGSWSSPPAPAGAAAWKGTFTKVASPFCWKGGSGTTSGTAAQKEGRGGKRRGRSFACPEGRRSSWCPRSQRPHCCSPLPPWCLFRKTNPRKAKKNKLPSPPPTFRKQQREKGWGEKQCYFILGFV